MADGYYGIHIPAEKIYLSPVIDFFDDLPVSWAVGTSPDANLVKTMIDSAIGTVKDTEHPIVQIKPAFMPRKAGYKTFQC